MIRKLLEAVGDLMDSASNEGCEPPLTVVDENHLQNAYLLAKEMKADIETGAPTLDLTTIKWDVFGPDEHPQAFLKGNLTIAGISFHVEADAVKDEDGVQQGVCDSAAWPAWPESEESESDGPFQTVRIVDYPYDYAVKITPHNS